MGISNIWPSQTDTRFTHCIVSVGNTHLTTETPLRIIYCCTVHTELTQFSQSIHTRPIHTHEQWCSHMETHTHCSSSTDTNRRTQMDTCKCSRMQQKRTGVWCPSFHLRRRYSLSLALTLSLWGLTVIMWHCCCHCCCVWGCSTAHVHIVCMSIHDNACVCVCVCELYLYLPTIPCFNISVGSNSGITAGSSESLIKSQLPSPYLHNAGHLSTHSSVISWTGSPLEQWEKCAAIGVPHRVKSPYLQYLTKCLKL